MCLFLLPHNLSQDSSRMETPSWWVTLVFARWGCIKTRALWLPPCSSLSGTVTLCTRGSWRTWAPTVQAGATLWVITPHWTFTAHGCTSPRVNWGPSLSGAAWCSTEEEGLRWIWGQIYKILEGRQCDILRAHWHYLNRWWQMMKYEMISLLINYLIDRKWMSHIYRFQLLKCKEFSDSFYTKQLDNGNNC